MKNRTLIIGIIISILIIIVIWIGIRRTDSPKLEKISIGTFSQAIDYGPVYIARNFGGFEDAIAKVNGGEVSYLEFDLPASPSVLHDRCRRRCYGISASPDFPHSCCSSSRRNQYYNRHRSVFSVPVASRT